MPAFLHGSTAHRPQLLCLLASVRPLCTQACTPRAALTFILEIPWKKFIFIQKLSRFSLWKVHPTLCIRCAEEDSKPVFYQNPTEWNMDPSEQNPTNQQLKHCTKSPKAQAILSLSIMWWKCLENLGIYLAWVTSCLEDDTRGIRFNIHLLFVIVLHFKHFKHTSSERRKMPNDQLHICSHEEQCVEAKQYEKKWWAENYSAKHLRIVLLVLEMRIGLNWNSIPAFTCFSHLPFSLSIEAQICIRR